MPAPTGPIQKLQQRRDQLRAQLAQVGDMRPGSLAERYRRCGKPNCHCAKEGEAGHGPSYSLTHAVGGKTVTRVIPPDAVETTQKQIEEYHRFRVLGQELVEANEHLCDARLRRGKAASEEAAEKKGFKRGSKPRSARKSKG